MLIKQHIDEGKRSSNNMMANTLQIPYPLIPNSSPENIHNRRTSLSPIRDRDTNRQAILSNPNLIKKGEFYPGGSMPIKPDKLFNPHANLNPNLDPNPNPNTVDHFKNSFGVGSFNGLFPLSSPQSFLTSIKGGLESKRGARYAAYPTINHSDVSQTRKRAWNPGNNPQHPGNMSLNNNTFQQPRDLTVRSPEVMERMPPRLLQLIN